MRCLCSGLSVDVEFENCVIYLRPLSFGLSIPSGFDLFGCGLMSALGHKRTYAMQKAMSAVPPIATAKADSHKWACPLYPR